FSAADAAQSRLSRRETRRVERTTASVVVLIVLLALLAIALVAVGSHMTPAPRTYLNTFASTVAMRSPRAGHTATLLIDGRVLVTGGSQSPGAPATNSVELYDPGNGAFGPVGSMAIARIGHTATRLLDGRVLILGGTSLGAPEAELFDPRTNTFSALSPPLNA